MGAGVLVLVLVGVAVMIHGVWGGDLRWNDGSGLSGAGGPSWEWCVGWWWCSCYDVWCLGRWYDGSVSARDDGEEGG